MIIFDRKLHQKINLAVKIKNTFQRLTRQVASTPFLRAQSCQWRENVKNHLKKMFIENSTLSSGKAKANTGTIFGIMQIIGEEDLYLKW